MGASGPGAINLTTGIANAFIDCAPDRCARRRERDRPLRQADIPGDRSALDDEADHEVGRPRRELKRIPEMLNNAFQKAMGGKPGPVYLDFPADVLYEKVDEAQVDWRPSGRPLLATAPAWESRRA
jgi:thiamine pyrophosphate-dependent acetolactate synthase large subunit-like protein